ncbi:1-aminocyclopropane-1-carboxylate deaminase/D-cysteine desulfhydrase [Olivibacter sitiensis]|uniref:1-aminocyclopropane-1-carboxylate deaminase/D-cysteine desulfhydrase n=1 Tax=Olivibacter sitiensis TaxID=376470 RepID=UPI000420DDF3|nr:pyridoxal-phosphate dependent enzyme [Olivibacter sitiensis]
MADFNFRSPEERIYHPLLDKYGVQLYVKRDDMIHPFISGNKWRKLKYLLQAASRQNKKHLVTFGGAWSNHIVATACAGARFGFRTTAYIRGEQVDNSVLMLCRLFGMKLRFVDRQSYRDKRELYDRYHGNETDAYFVDEGGSSLEAVRGCAEIITELENPYDHICCACGTGTTIAGIAAGLNEQQLNMKPHAFPVLKGAGFLQKDLLELGVDSDQLVWHYDYHFGGYGKTPPLLLQFIHDFARQTGVLLDPIYTGKLFFGIFDLVKNGYFPTNSRILAIHTGGLTGLLGKQDDLLRTLNDTNDHE